MPIRWSSPRWIVPSRPIGETLLGTASCFIAMCLGTISFVQKGSCPEVLEKGAFTFEVDSASGRPIYSAAREVARKWIAEVLDGSTANEYLSAADGFQTGEGEDEELLPAETHPKPRRSALRPPIQQPEVEDTEALHVRIAQLESLLTNQGHPAAPGQRDELGRSSVLAGKKGGLSAQEVGNSTSLQLVLRQLAWVATKLQSVARTAGARDHFVGSRTSAGFGSEQSRIHCRDVAPSTSPDKPAGESPCPEESSRSTDCRPQRWGQRKRFVIRRCRERERLRCQRSVLKQILEDQKVIEVIRANARTELGISATREEPSLLRTYLEQRVPTGDHKTLIQVGYMLAAGWEIGVEQNNRALMAFAARMMVYVEQACLDGGRTQLAWLMTGLSEPNFQQLSVNRRRSTLSPFSRLASPTWIAANVLT